MWLKTGDKWFAKDMPQLMMDDKGKDKPEMTMEGKTRETKDRAR
jgi:hypothetical protein